MQGWKIYLGSKLIDTVFTDSDCDADYVRFLGGLRKPMAR